MISFTASSAIDRFWAPQTGTKCVFPVQALRRAYLALKQFSKRSYGVDTSLYASFCTYCIDTSLYNAIPAPTTQRQSKSHQKTLYFHLYMNRCNPASFQSFFTSISQPFMNRRQITTFHILNNYKIHLFVKRCENATVGLLRYYKH